MTPTAAVVAKCFVLWGPKWTGPAAEALEISPRTLQRIAAAEAKGEDYAAAEGVLRALGELLSEVSAIG